MEEIILRKPTLHDSGVSIGKKELGGVFRRVDNIPLSAKKNKHTASVEGYREIIKTRTIPVSAPLGFIASVKLPDYI